MTNEYYSHNIRKDFLWMEVINMGKYKLGKQTEILSFSTIRELVSKAKLYVESEAYFWILYYCGVRKSEAYERVAEDFKVTNTHLTIDFHQRKKQGATVEPLELPRAWPGVNKIVESVEKAQNRKARFKNLYVYVDRKRTAVKTKGKWVFPHIQSTKAWDIAKKVLGDKYYPHFLRLNRLSEIGSDPSASLLRLKSFSGIKSARVLDQYLGTSKKEQKKALDFMDQQIR